jgi:hypothetical protein
MNLDILTLLWVVFMVVAPLVYIARNEYNFLSDKKYNPFAGVVSLICAILLLLVLEVDLLFLVGWVSKMLPISRLNMLTSFVIVIFSFVVLSIGHMCLGYVLGQQLHKKMNGKKT